MQIPQSVRDLIAQGRPRSFDHAEFQRRSSVGCSNLTSRKMITLRKASERGRTRFEWLDSRHTFSFADYYEPLENGYSVRASSMTIASRVAAASPPIRIATAWALAR